MKRGKRRERHRDEGDYHNERSAILSRKLEQGMKRHSGEGDHRDERSAILRRKLEGGTEQHPGY